MDCHAEKMYAMFEDCTTVFHAVLTLQNDSSLQVLKTWTDEIIILKSQHSMKYSLWEL